VGWLAVRLVDLRRQHRMHVPRLNTTTGSSASASALNSHLHGEAKPRVRRICGGASERPTSGPQSRGSDPHLRWRSEITFSRIRIN
jgi:hypothetical protein